MKIISLSLILLCLGSFSLSAQNYKQGRLTKTDGTLVTGRIAIDNASEEILIKENNTIQKLKFDQVQDLNIGDRTYSPAVVDGSNWMVHTLVSGTASLHHGGGDNYGVTKENGQAQSFSLSENNNRIAGILSVLFEDCNAIRETLYKQDEFSERSLVQYVSNYNTCSYSDYAPTDGEIARAKSFNTDTAQFYAGPGAGFGSVSFFDSNSTEGNTSFGINAGVTVSPSFLGTIQGNLHFYLEGSALFSGSTDFSNAGSPVDFKKQIFRAVIGTEYYFNKSGKINPFIGIGVGATSDSFDGSVAGDTFDITGGNTIYAPRAGVLFQLTNGKHVGVVVQYISEYENDLSFPKGEVIIPLMVNTRSLTVSLNYYF